MAEAARRPRLVLEIDVSERTPVGVADDEAGVGFLGGPGRRKRRGEGLEPNCMLWGVLTGLEPATSLPLLSSCHAGFR